MNSLRQKSLPQRLRDEIKQARLARGWSQLALGEKVGLAQRHISGIETGKIVPRYDTLIEILRALDLDLVLVPRELLPAVQSLLAEYRLNQSQSGFDWKPLYAVDDDGDDEVHDEELKERGSRQEPGDG